VRQLLHLHRHVVDAPRVVVPPQGVRVRAFVPGKDDEPWLRLNNRIFAGHPENGSWTIDDLHSRLAQPWFRPADLLMLELDGALSGFCWLKVDQPESDDMIGEIYVIGTSPECRGLGLGRFLVDYALLHLRSRGVRTAAIYVDESNTAAVSLYERAAFHHHHVDVCYSRSLTAGLRHGNRIEAAA
jgi:mycothiol synthase